MVKPIRLDLGQPREIFGNPVPLGLLGLAVGCVALVPSAFGHSLTPAGLQTAAVFALLFGALVNSVVGRNVFHLGEVRVDTWRPVTVPACSQAVGRRSTGRWCPGVDLAGQICGNERGRLVEKGNLCFLQSLRLRHHRELRRHLLKNRRSPSWATNR